MGLGASSATSKVPDDPLPAVWSPIALALCALVQLSQAQSRRLVIATSYLLDGKGHVLHNTRIVVEGSKLVAIDPKAEPVGIDLRGSRVLPGWIDAHDHTRSFGRVAYIFRRFSGDFH